MRKEIKIDPDGGVISTNVEIQGQIAAGYYLQLYEVNSNNVVFEYSGTNEFDDDDYRTLPNTAEKNIGRVIMLDTTVACIEEELEEGLEFTIILSIIQDGEIVGEARYTNQLIECVQSSLIIVKLIQ
jgi:hypothetical protein